MNRAQDFIESYYERFTTALEAFDRAPLPEILRVLERVRRRGGTLWVAGNGGSSSIAEHWVCDATKGTFVSSRPALRAQSLTSNGALLTALANDIAYEEVFRQQLIYFLQPRDAVLLVSSSGNSANVVRACQYAREQGVPTIAFVGFDGGELRRLAEWVVWVPVHNYGMVEDAHQSLMHCLTQYLRVRAEASPGTRKARSATKRRPERGRSPAVVPT
ncbi:MAG: SIS domain-containing protein [Proteobacteria bacterium]|nr:SIS domain-containing protein [Pseudomonadota bacterium]